MFALLGIDVSQIVIDNTPHVESDLYHLLRIKLAVPFENLAVLLLQQISWHFLISKNSRLIIVALYFKSLSKER
ncbi:hypothetical protein VMF7928_00430 [Vibrio marisflavi CECT 7928]|uniref:Uncharacterized protein n=1 Tax=Vibrio marisflavi CECT 7928 TaxID=634439 RepID=A0ABM9A0M6_9VIBR|nr:hypothetical protein VMF7928_00430 [Vibrio marisflavi CECT 7928]